MNDDVKRVFRMLDVGDVREEVFDACDRPCKPALT